MWNWYPHCIFFAPRPDLLCNVTGVWRAWSSHVGYIGNCTCIVCQDLYMFPSDYSFETFQSVPNGHHFQEIDVQTDFCFGPPFYGDRKQLRNLLNLRHLTLFQLQDFFFQYEEDRSKFLIHQFSSSVAFCQSFKIAWRKEVLWNSGPHRTAGKVATNWPVLFWLSYVLSSKQASNNFCFLSSGKITVISSEFKTNISVLRDWFLFVDNKPQSPAIQLSLPHSLYTLQVYLVGNYHQRRKWINIPVIRVWHRLVSSALWNNVDSYLNHLGSRYTDKVGFSI